ncbi:MAG: hypothetical protein IKU07_10650 [Oscillospiraceae bacterium]|nr:hypothetical protein [Oscillospiraceae bacterium]
MKLLDDLAEGIVKTEREMTERSNASRKKRWSFYSVASLLLNVFTLLFLLAYVLTKNLISANFPELFYTTFAAAALISSVLFFDIYITCESYKHKRPYKILMPFMVQLCLITIVVWLCGLENIVNVLVNGVVVATLKPVLAGVGCLSFITSSLYLTFSGGSFGKRGKTSKSQKTAVSEKTVSPMELCKKRKRAISDNAITIGFVKKQWDFLPGEEALFGYDKNTESFVFVGDIHSRIIEQKAIVFLDYEDYLIDKTNGTAGMIAGAILGGMMMGIYGAIVCGAEGRLASQGRRIERVIKLYYMDKSGTEQVVAFYQDFKGERVYGDGGIEELKKFSENTDSSNTEIVFRQKLRAMCAELNKETYLSRPFLNDRWFSVLKEKLEAVTNYRTNSYVLFRQLVIEDECYRNLVSVHTIVQEMSEEKPDFERITREARELCFQDALSGVSEKAKDKIKGLFRKKK